MATRSIFKNITLKDKKLCENFVSALENAKGKSSVQPQISKRVEHVKRGQIKDFFGES